MRLVLKNEERKFISPPGFEPRSPKTESQCVTNELYLRYCSLTVVKLAWMNDLNMNILSWTDLRFPKVENLRIQLDLFQ